MRSTHWVLVITSIVLIGLDLYWARTPREGDTLSEVIRKYAKRWLVIPFLAGVLAGHLFWPL